MIENILKGLDLILTPEVMVFIVIGIALGILVGATPGIGPPVGIALILPLTIAFESWSALAMLFALYVGAMYGGAVSAIIINVPGTPGAIASTFDGYPLSRQGKARSALEISVLASAFGTVLAALILIAIAPILVEIILMVGTPEYALVAVFGLAIIPIVSQQSMAKSILAGSFGVLLSTVGMAPMSTTPRFTFGLLGLTEGLTIVAVLLGVFAVSEMIKLSAYEGSIGGGDDGETDLGESIDSQSSLVGRVVKIFVKNPATFVKSMVIGLVIGFIPAAGGSVSNIVAYATEKQLSDDPDSFGTGNIRGLISSESANSGTIAGSLVPLLAFGIPGSATAAIILGGMIMHGIRPGPGLFTDNIHITYATYIAVIAAGILLLVIGLLTVTKMSCLTKVSMDIFVPIVIILCIVGSFALDLNYLDVISAGAFGLLSYLMMKYDYSLVALVMGLILGPVIESNGYRSFQLGDVSIFWESTLSLVLLVLTILALVGPPAKILYTRITS
ncbi:MAG: tripartite tricarboxylate transporter permease [Halobacteriota archaeon]